MEEFDPVEFWPPPAEAGSGRSGGATSGGPPIPYVGFETDEDEQRAEAAFLSLSGREMTVLAYLSYGLSAKQVALTLKVSSRTIDTFRTRALLKLRARNTADAVRILATLSARAHAEGP
jgi:DNA-binding CsgD family transcriptional regulator